MTILIPALAILLYNGFTNMITPNIIRDFISDNERIILNDWCLNNYQNRNLFIDGGTGLPGTRLTTRHVTNDECDFPEVAYEIQKRIIVKLNLTNYKFPEYKNGIVCGIGFKNGHIWNHKDRIWYPDTTTVHCNIITQKPTAGGITVINEEKYETNEHDLLVYPVSEILHRVTRIQGLKPRILWCFGFCLSQK